MASKQPQRLRVVTLANPKGGVGKSTLCAALAVRAVEESRRVALFDLDPQESLSSWWTRRGKTKNPKLFEVGAAVEAIELLISEGWNWVFVDTSPARIDLIESGIAVSRVIRVAECGNGDPRQWPELSSTRDRGADQARCSRLSAHQ